MKEKKLLGFYDYTVVLTYIGLLTGFIGIQLAADGRFREAIMCLMIAGVCDMFDGAVARTKKRTIPEQKFGIQIDSLSDLVCFGVLPAMVVSRMNRDVTWSFGIAAAYVLCALIRLAYFNVCEEKRQHMEAGARTYFQGLPVTSAAILIPAVYVLTEQGAWFTLVLAGMGICFLLPFRLKKPQVLGKVILSVTGAIEMIFVVFCAVGDV